MKPIVLYAQFGPLGGANSEAWHSLKLWRQFGLQVSLVPLGGPLPLAWHQKIAATGCRIVWPVPKDCSDLPGIEDSIAVALCHHHFWLLVELLKQRGARIVWVPCMSYPFPESGDFTRSIDAWVCQSDYQRCLYTEHFAPHGIPAERFHLIHGAFDVNDFPFHPKRYEPGGPFVVGRMSRVNPNKYHRRTWDVLGKIPGVRARFMGWCNAVRSRIGAPPEWAETMLPGKESPQDFLASLHCMVHLTEVAENWPQVGLEAMATGVPIVAENRGGWPEMIEHGETGFLCNEPDEAAEWATLLARKPEERGRIIANAREAVEEICQPEALWRPWQRLFRQLSNDREMVDNRTVPCYPEAAAGLPAGPSAEGPAT